MLVLTTDSLPENFTVKEIFGMVEVTHPIEVSQKPFLRRLTEGQTNEHDRAYTSLIRAAKDASQGRGNLLYGVKASTAVGNFNNGTFLYMTYIGTVAEAEW